MIIRHLRITLTSLLLTAAGILQAQDEVDRLEQFRRATGLNLHGFLDYRVGQRLQHDDYEDDDSLNEVRLQLELDKLIKSATMRLRADLIYDALDDEQHDVNLERGEGWFDLREANLLFSPVRWMDVKVGRQILTWGTGDRIFINDLFPKDWVSFFIGRDQDYLKAPSDAILFSIFPEDVDIYIAYTPRFDPDRYVTGERISYYNNMLGRRAGRDTVQNPMVPDDWFEEDEIAVRLAKNIRSYELSAYYYEGYWKSPGGMDRQSQRPIFPPLRAWGFSGRGLVGKGIANLEFGHYYSKDDPGGDDPLVNNSELRFLLGYQREIGKNLTLGLQYYLEHMMHYPKYENSLPPTAEKRDRDRHVTTLSLTKLLMNQDLSLSFFGFYSPSDHDVFLQPSVNYKINDTWQAGLGANIFAGKYEHSFFGQFEHNSNLYVHARCSF